MKSFSLGQHSSRNCEGVSRRDVLKVGALSFFGLSLPQFLALRQASAAGTTPKADACIVLWLAGGPSHIDTFDPKPDAPAEFRGEFNPIETSVSGIRISEHLPLTAKEMDKFAIVRSLTSTIGAHEQASEYMMTGFKPLPVLEYPSYGSVVAKELGVRKSLPPFIAIPDMTRGTSAGFLGNAYNAFPVGDPGAGKFRVANVDLPTGVDDKRLDSRRGLVGKLNSRFSEHREDGQAQAVDTFYQRAYDLVTSADAKKALDLSQESAATRERYGSTTVGQGALLARRLVEAGTRFVSVNMGGWDTHQDNWNRLKTKQLPPLDAAYAALLSDLAQRGMLEKTLVVLAGEFGRTPRINNVRGGRDHYPRVRFACFAGGGVKGGRVVGASDAQGAEPADRPVSVEDVAATIYSTLGISTETTYTTPTGRPIRIVQGGNPVKELF